jgi:hypothetical protein
MRKNLRIAATMLCLVACALLVTLWVRSYFARDMLRGVVRSQAVYFTSLRGKFAIGIDVWPHAPFGWTNESKSDKSNMRAVFPTVTGKRPLSIIGFRWLFTPRLIIVVVPHWFILLITAACAAIPWIKLQFGLRTLLIAMTLVAAFLGLIAISG